MPHNYTNTIPVFVVSLPDCTDRRDTIAKSLANLGIEFEFVDAIDGRYGLDPQYEDQIDRVAARRAGHILSDSEFACALSHITIYQRIVSQNIAYALILEDDALPSPQLVNFLTGCYYRDADLTQLYYSRAYVRWQGAVRVLFDSHVSYLHAPRLKVTGAVAYTVSYQAALHFVKYALPINREADWPLCIQDLIAKRQCRVICPPLVGHPPVEQKQKQSVLSKHGRTENKEKRRFLGMYVPPFRRMVESWGRAPYKLLAKRLPPPP